jgi:hypothetical protein
LIVPGCDIQKAQIWILEIWKGTECEKGAPEKKNELTHPIITKAADTICWEKSSMADKIWDGYSIHHIAKILGFPSASACALAGWFFGGVAGTRLVQIEVDCPQHQKHIALDLQTTTPIDPNVSNVTDASPRCFEEVTH